MVKKRTTTPREQLCESSTRQNSLARRRCAELRDDPAAAIHQPVKRYITFAMILAVVAGGLLILAGYPPLGKGLILGAIFSIINFILMAVALPLRMGRGRGPSTLISLGSIAVRYVVMATPLIIAVHQSQFSIVSTAAGLFMIQLVILLDQAWAARRIFVGAEE